ATAPSATTAAPTIATAALEVLKTLALLSASLPVLGLALHVLHFGGRTSTGAIISDFAGTVIAALTGAVVAARRRRSLLATLRSGPLLRTFRPLPVRLGLVYGIPASVVVLLPTVAGILVNIPIMPGIHIAAGGFTSSRVAPGRTRAGGLAALRP